MGNRKAATAEAVKWLEELLPGSENARVFEEQLNRLSDAQFDAYIGKLESGEATVSLTAPNLSKHKLTIENNLRVAKLLGHDFFERLWLTDPVTNVLYLTPVKYMVVDLPLRRQQQLLVEKMSVPEDNNHIDELTGQPAGVSAAARVSFPELQVLYAQGLDASIEELIKFRGGDIKAFQAMNREIVNTGGASMASIKRVPTRVKSTETLSTILKAMHLDNTL